MELLVDGIAAGAVVKTDTSRKITIGGITKVYDVYKVRLDHLYYNDQSTRIATWMSKYRSEHKGSGPCPDDLVSYNQTIENFVIESNAPTIRKTQNGIKEIGQTESAVVLHDGRIIDGNRRFTCLRLLADENEKYNWMEAVILDPSYGANTKEIKKLELALQYAEGKIDYNPVDELVGIYQDVEKDKIFTAEEYAKETNQTPNAVKSKIRTAKLMAEYLSFINAPAQYHIIRDLKLYFPLSELNLALGKFESKQPSKVAEDLKVCVFTNIFMRTSEDLGRFVRSIRKDIMPTPFFNEYIEEQKQIALKVLDSLPPIRSANFESLSKTVKENAEYAKALERSFNKSLLKSRKSAEQNRSLRTMEDVNALLSTITREMFDEYTPDESDSMRKQIQTAYDLLDKLKGYMGERNED